MTGHDHTSLPRMIASDLDGTFLSPDGTVSEVNARAVRAAAERGIAMVFATGRPIRWLEAVTGLDGLHPVVVASNGAMLYDAADDTILHARPIEDDAILAVAHDVRRRLPAALFAVEYGRRFGREADYPVPRGTTAEVMQTAPIHRLAGVAPVVKLLIKHHDMTCDALFAEVAPIVGDRLTVTHSADPAAGLLELSAPGVSKASTLAAYCAELGIAAHEVAAFGDMPNDLAMLTWAGRPYVMADSHPLLLRLEAGRAGTNADSGVGRTILSWLDQA